MKYRKKYRKMAAKSTKKVIAKLPQKHSHDRLFSKSYHVENPINVGQSIKLIAKKMAAKAIEFKRVDANGRVRTAQVEQYINTARIITHILNAQLKDGATKGKDYYDELLERHGEEDCFRVNTNNRTLGVMMSGINVETINDFQSALEEANKTVEEYAETRIKSIKRKAYNHRKRLEDYGFLLGTEHEMFSLMEVGDKTVLNSRHIDRRSNYTLLINKEWIVVNNPLLEPVVLGEVAPSDTTENGQEGEANTTQIQPKTGGNIGEILKKSTTDNQVVIGNNNIKYHLNPILERTLKLEIKNGEANASNFLSTSNEVGEKKETVGGGEGQNSDPKSKKRWEKKIADKRQKNVTQNLIKNPAGEQVVTNFLVALLEYFRHLMYDGKTFNKMQVASLMIQLRFQFLTVRDELALEQNNRLEEHMANRWKKTLVDDEKERKRLQQNYRIYEAKNRAEYRKKYCVNDVNQEAFNIIQNAADWAHSYIMNNPAKYESGWCFGIDKWVDFTNENGLKGAIQRSLKSYKSMTVKNQKNGKKIVISDIVFRAEKAARKVMAAYATETAEKFEKIKHESRVNVYNLIHSKDAVELLSIEERKEIYSDFMAKIEPFQK